MPWTEVTPMDGIGSVSDLEAPSVPRPAERVKGTHVAPDQRLLLGPRPAFELKFTADCGFRRQRPFNIDDALRRIPT
jgi:hypothetical protein